MAVALAEKAFKQVACCVYSRNYCTEANELERRPSLNPKQVLELSERQKWEIKDELMEKKVIRRIGSKSQMRMRKLVVEAYKVELKSVHHELVLLNNTVQLVFYSFF